MLYIGYSIILDAQSIKNSTLTHKISHPRPRALKSVRSLHKVLKNWLGFK